MLVLTSGIYKGLKINAPDGAQTRPSAQRLRQAVMNVIRSYFGHAQNLSALDLFAGSGAVGFELLSAGFQSVHFVENHFQTVRILKKNMKRFAENAKTVQKTATQSLKWDATLEEEDVLVFLTQDQTLKDQRFDVIWADPPYDQGYFLKILKILSKVPDAFLKSEGLFFFEENADIPLLNDEVYDLLKIANLELMEVKKYGGSQVVILVRRMGEAT